MIATWAESCRLCQDPEAACYRLRDRRRLFLWGAEESGLSMLFLTANVQAFNYQGSPSFLAYVQNFWRPQALNSRLLGSSTDYSATVYILGLVVDFSMGFISQKTDLRTSLGLYVEEYSGMWWV